MQVPDLIRFLSTVHPYDTLAPDHLAELAAQCRPLTFAPGQDVYQAGDAALGLYLIVSGAVDVFTPQGAQISHLGPGNSFGERGLMRDGNAVTRATATAESCILLLPASIFAQLIATQSSFATFFARGPAPASAPPDLTSLPVEAFMTRDPLCCAPDTSVQAAADMMRTNRVSSICVTDARGLLGIVTQRDMTSKVVARALPFDTPTSEIMTQAPLTLGPDALGSDVLHMMMERRIGHVPICRNEHLLGIVTQTDLTRVQATQSSDLVADIARATDATDIAKSTARIPALLVQLVASGRRHDIVTRLITDIADAATRRLLALAEQKLGPAPVPYLWLACGSQGRQEQTGVSDQDNCLILHDSLTPDDLPYFHALAEFVCAGLDRCGYVFCPGDMMATNPRWCQPLAVWRSYFQGWIDTPSPEAQMLASVMFDLRPIGGDASLFKDLQHDTLHRAAQNSIFVAHMLANSLTHTPPLGLLRGLATIRSGEHKNQLDLKHNGVVPVVDLGRIYALRAKLEVANTRARLIAARAAGALSDSGGRDLIDAYDLIAQTRLDHQARQIKRGVQPDNYLPPANLSDFERSHVRDAFVVVKSLQSALGHGKGALG